MDIIDFVVAAVEHHLSNPEVTPAAVSQLVNKWFHA